MLAPAFHTPLHKHIKLPDLINLQEQLSFSEEMSHATHPTTIGSSVVAPDGSHSSFPQAGTDVSHYGPVYWKLITIIWKVNIINYLIAYLVMNLLIGQLQV